MFRVTHTLLGGRALGQIGRTTINYAQFGTAVTASMVKELRESSGAPMMDCKKALTESDADMEKAMDWLRAKGIAKAVKSASREATEGLIGVRSMTSGGLILIEVNSETDFVSRNDDFHKFVTNIADRTKAMHEANQLTVGGDGKVDTQAFLQADGGAMQNMLTDAINVIRENIVLRRIECIEGMGAGGGEEVLSSYVHGKVYSASDLTLGTQASVVSLVGGPGLVDKHEHVAEIGRKLAMHVVAAAPMYATHAEVPTDFLEREQAVLREQMEESGQTKGKAPDMVEKILKGKVSKRLSEVCMTSQAHFAEEGSPVVEKHLKAQAGTLSLTNLALGGFRRWTLGSN